MPAASASVSPAATTTRGPFRAGPRPGLVSGATSTSVIKGSLYWLHAAGSGVSGKGAGVAGGVRRPGVRAHVAAPHRRTSCYDSESAVTEAASAISSSEGSASFVPRFDRIDITMGAPSAGHTTAMSLRAP